MFESLTLKPEAFGLDISDLSLKIIKLKKKGKFFDLTCFAEEKIKPGIIKEGEIKKEEDLVKVIKNALTKVKGEKLKTKYVVASLPEEKAFLQVIQMPRLPEKDLKSAVIYESENYIPLPIEQVYLDSQIIPPVYNHLDHTDVLIAALPKKTVDPYLTCLKKAGLKLAALEIESLAITRALIKDEVTNRPVLLIDFGATRTGFIIFSGHSVRFTFSIPVSSYGFTETIAKNFNVDITEAEKLKIKYGLEEKVQLKMNNNFERKFKKGRVFEALIPPLIDLTQQIKKYLHYYQTHSSHEHLPLNDKSITKILICGGGAKMKGLAFFLSDQLKIPVEIGNPWINILPSKIQPKEQALIYEKEESLGYTTALGLALRGVKRDD